MDRRAFLVKAVLVLVLIWGAVWGIRAWAGSKRITAEKVSATIEAAALEDWSAHAEAPDTAAGKRREEKLREIAGLVNRLDFAERQKSRDDRTPEQFFRKLSGAEKRLFIDLTIRESMGKFMEALDALPPDERKKFVEQGLRDIEEGRTEEEMLRAKELGDDLLETISSEGLRAYFEKASADTKLDLAPLMEAINETMQGLRGPDFGPGQR